MRYQGVGRERQGSRGDIYARITTSTGKATSGIWEDIMESKWAQQEEGKDDRRRYTISNVTWWSLFCPCVLLGQ